MGSSRRERGSRSLGHPLGELKREKTQEAETRFESENQTITAKMHESHCPDVKGQW
jgi:hypothetical protein